MPEPNLERDGDEEEGRTRLRSLVGPLFSGFLSGLLLEDRRAVPAVIACSRDSQSSSLVSLFVRLG